MERIEKLEIRRIATDEGFIPERPIQPGTLYVSERYQTAIHLCACGCGNEVVTPLSRDGWSLDGNTLRPSVLNRQCQSHYLIADGNVTWL